jgi:carbon-monoxide dehydrogenase large subunit
VLDALAPLGVKDFDMPATPHRVWEAMKKGSVSATQEPQKRATTAATQGRPT